MASVSSGGVVVEDSRLCVGGESLAQNTPPVVVEMEANAARSEEEKKSRPVSYTAKKIIGNGSFGVVFLAKRVDSGEIVAIKKVLQDRRFKNRELQIMHLLRHPNIVAMKHCFFSNGEQASQIYLNLVLEYVPDTVYRFTRMHSKRQEFVPLFYVKLFTFQLCRSLTYIHSLGICHRDIKPQNLLIDPSTGILKLCDFGSAKQLVPGEPNVSYICSRYYRAPELVFGATDYSFEIDVWSAGCVMAELLLGHPFFCGESSVDQLVEIIKILGTPSSSQIERMNPNYTEFQFPNVKAVDFSKVFESRSDVSSDALDLLSRLLVYSPSERISAVDALAHPFFDEIKQTSGILPEGQPLPDFLMHFTSKELIHASRATIEALLSQGADIENVEELVQARSNHE